jgi:hypothetical protein
VNGERGDAHTSPQAPEPFNAFNNPLIVIITRLHR